MNPLLHRLGVVRRRFQVVTVFSGVFALMAFLIGAAAAIGVYDYHNHLPRLVRASALVGLLAGSGFIVFRYLVHPLAKRSDNLSLALRIEAKHPELNDALASTIQFLDSPESPSMGDKQMREKAIEKATLQAASFDFHAILDYRFLGIMALALVTAVAAGAHFLYHEPELSRTALLRLGDPFGFHPWTQIEVVNAVDRVAVGQKFHLDIEVDGIVPPDLKVEVQTKKPKDKAFESRPDAPVVLRPNGGMRPVKASLQLDIKPHDLTSERQTVRYRVLGNDGSFPPRQWQEVKVMQPPSFSALDGLPSPQLELHFPEYTQLKSPLKLSPGTMPIDVIQGTEVIFRAAADRPLKSATIELKTNEAAQRLREVSLVGLIGDPAMMSQIGPAGFLTTFSWFVPLELDETRTKMTGRFRPFLSGDYVVRLVDDDGLEKKYSPQSMTVSIDPPPMVRLRHPAASQSFLPEAQVPIRIVADDELAVHSVFLEYRKKNAQGGDWVDPAPKRFTIYEPAMVAAALRGLTNAPAPFEKHLTLRPKRLDLSMQWNLKKNKFQVGDVITLQAAADDYCDVFTPRLPGRSQEIEIRIVSKDNLDRELDQNLVEVQQDVLALKKLADDVQQLLDDIPKDAPKDKQDPKALDKTLEAEDKVKQLQERIGERANDGLRAKLEQIQQTMKDNKLPGSETQDQVKNLAQQLERLAQDDLPKLEQDLSDLRKEKSGVKQPDPKQKSPLEKSKDDSKDVRKTLDDLARDLNRFADLAQLKGQTRELIEKQEKLAEKLKDHAELEKVDDKGAAQKMLQEDAAKIANEQIKIATEVKGLIERIKEAKKRQDDLGRKEEAAGEDGDKDAKQRAEDAKDAAKKLRSAEGATEGLMKQLRDAVEELKGNDPHPNAALDKQKQAGKTLEKVAKALEGQKDDDIDRLRKKQKEANAAQAGIEKLQKNVKDAQKDQKANVGEKDREQQAQNLRDNAEDLREQARRLMRLQEPKAARELQKAADNLDNAAKQLEAGDEMEAQNQEMEAQEHLQKAQEQLEHLRQELAREQLAQIGDRLKGLKERQDAATEGTRELQAKIEAKGQWTRGLLDTLDGNQQTQTGLAKETQSLEEKLKGALVFEHILKKAGKAMEQAGAAMGEHKTAGKDRQTKELYKAEQDDEKKRYEETLKLQKLAGDRLDRLLEALKDAPPQVAKKKDDKAPPKKENPEGMEPGEQGNMGGGDGIPPMAQLKALKAEQVEVYERTKEFSRVNPDPANLDERRQAELRELTEEQGRLRQLFEQMTRREGDMK